MASAHGKDSFKGDNMIEVKNRRVVIPFLEDVEITVPKNTRTYDRKEQVFSTTSAEVYQITLPFTPLCTELTEVYEDGIRRINPRIERIPGGTSYSEYNVFGNTINFQNAISGDVKVVCETEPYPQYNVTTIEIDNAQGYLSVGISLFHEPVIITEPTNGYARLSFNRKELVYLPKMQFTGKDSFSYTLINNQGQFGNPRCVYVTVA